MSKRAFWPLRKDWRHERAILSLVKVVQLPQRCAKHLTDEWPCLTVGSCSQVERLRSRPILP